MIRRSNASIARGKLNFCHNTDWSRSGLALPLCSQPKPMPLTAEASARIASCSLPRTNPSTVCIMNYATSCRYTWWATLIRLAMCSSRLRRGISRDAESEATSLCQPNSKLPPLVDDRAGLRAQDVLAHIVERLGKGRGGAQAVFLETTVHSGEEGFYMRFAVRKAMERFGFASKLESSDVILDRVEHPDA